MLSSEFWSSIMTAHIMLCNITAQKETKNHTDCAKDDESPIRYDGKNGLWVWEGPVGDPINIDSDVPCIIDCFGPVQTCCQHFISVHTCLWC